jgi:hypothetical protein
MYEGRPCPEVTRQGNRGNAPGTWLLYSREPVRRALHRAGETRQQVEKCRFSLASAAKQDQPARFGQQSGGSASAANPSSVSRSQEPSRPEDNCVPVHVFRVVCNDPSPRIPVPRRLWQAGKEKQGGNAGGCALYPGVLATASGWSACHAMFDVGWKEWVGPGAASRQCHPLAQFVHLSLRHWPGGSEGTTLACGPRPPLSSLGSPDLFPACPAAFLDFRGVEPVLSSSCLRRPPLGAGTRSRRRDDDEMARVRSREPPSFDLPVLFNLGIFPYRLCVSLNIAEGSACRGYLEQA